MRHDARELPSLPPALSPRGEPRIGTQLEARIYSRSFPGALAARSRDVSVGGICVVTPSPFALDAVERLSLALPEGELALDVEGRWQQALPGDDVVMTGLAFRAPPDAAVDRLWNLVLDGAKQLARFLYAGSELRPLGVDGAVGIAQVTRLREVAAGSTLYRQGVRGPGQSSIFVVERGRVILQVRVRNAIETPIDRLEPGRVFGGLPMLADLAPSESAVAETDVRVLEFDEPGFHYLARTKPWLAQQLAQVVTTSYVRRMHWVLERVQDRL